MTFNKSTTNNVTGIISLPGSFAAKYPGISGAPYTRKNGIACRNKKSIPPVPVTGK